MTDIPATSTVLVLRAEDAPAQNGTGSSANQRYRHPKISLETRTLAPLAPDDVRVAMIYAGICGTDLDLLQSDAATGFIQTSAPASIPREGRVMGHEGVGRVLATGSNVHSLAPGAIVAFASIVACLHCDVCRRGAFNQCPNAPLLGMQVDGLFGSVVDVPASIAYDVSQMGTDRAGLRAAACIEPASVALLACENARVSPGDSVAIFGAGPIGLFCAMACKRVLGAAHVAVIEPIAFRRDAAAQWCDAVYGVDTYLNGTESTVDVVIEASGDLSNIQRILHRIRPGGRVVLLGRRGLALDLENVDHMITQAISIMGSRGHLGGPFSRIVSLYHAGLMPLDAAITHEAPSLEALHSILRNAAELPEAQCKVVARIDGAGS